MEPQQTTEKTDWEKRPTQGKINGDVGRAQCRIVELKGHQKKNIVPGRCQSRIVGRDPIAVTFVESETDNIINECQEETVLHCER